MTEYIIIVAVIAIAAIAAFKIFGTHVQDSVKNVGTALEGASKDGITTGTADSK